MLIQAKVAPDGKLKITSLEPKSGENIWLVTRPTLRNADKGYWSDIESALEEVDRMDFPRRSEEEIIRDLHRSRG